MRPTRFAALVCVLCIGNPAAAAAEMPHLGPAVAYQQALIAKAANDLPRAQALLQPLCQADSGWALPCVDLGEVLLDVGATAQAMQMITIAIAIDATNARAWLDRGRLLALNNEPLPALAAYREAHQLKPEWLEATFLLGDALETNQQPLDAMRLYEASATMQPDDVTLQIRLASLYESHDRLPAAEAALLRVLATAAKNPGYLRALVNFYQRHAMQAQADKYSLQLQRLQPKPARNLRPLR